MQEAIRLRELYRPVQPTVKQTALSVSYCEISPDERLADIIFCYWELKTNEELQEPFAYRVVADGCIDIFFQVDKPTENFIMGFCKKYTEFLLENKFRYIGIRFLPTMFPAWFGVDASDLSNRFERLELVNATVAKFIGDSFSESDDLATAKIKLDGFFNAVVGNLRPILDGRFLHALSIILRNSGVVNVQTDLDTGLSQRQMRRLFEYYVGDTAKTFSQVVRFQHILRAKPSTESLRKNKIFFDLGYYDLAHFIKEFKNFYGVTPSKAFGR